MIQRLKKKLKQLVCMHYWQKGFEIDIMYTKGYLYPFDCLRCGKKIKRWSGNEPISESRHPIYDKKDPVYNMSPPVIPFKE